MVPLILTLRLDDTAFQFFNQLRKAHFPPERNFLDAHLTLFHHLPHTPELVQQCAEAAANIHGPVDLQVTGLYKLGGGVAYRLESEKLLQLHRQLQSVWKPLLTRQDQQGLRPHVTVQNKTTAAEASALYQELAAVFIPFRAQGLGLDVWTYLGGPWQHMRYYPFGGAPPTDLPVA